MGNCRKAPALGRELQMSLFCTCFYSPSMRIVLVLENGCICKSQGWTVRTIYCTRHHKSHVLTRIYYRLAGGGHSAVLVCHISQYLHYYMKKHAKRDLRKSHCSEIYSLLRPVAEPPANLCWCGRGCCVQHLSPVSPSGALRGSSIYNCLCLYELGH